MTYREKVLATTLGGLIALVVTGGVFYLFVYEPVSDVGAQLNFARTELQKKQADLKAEETKNGKILEVKKGCALSLQKHERKIETMYLQSGRIRYHFNGIEFEFLPGSCLTIRPGDVHRVEALEDSVILEVSTPHLDDVIRLEDRYGRS